MSMIDIDVKVDIRLLGNAFDRLRRFRVETVLKALRRPARADQADHGRNQSGPGGRWAPLAASTLERYARMGIKRKRILGRLPTALESRVTGKSLTLLSRARRYSMVHQDGPMRVGHGAIVPQRQFLWISAKLQSITVQRFEEALLRAWNGTP